ncbi:MAG: ribosome-associated translation inhibitor RaiA [Myxococcales bacterium]|nr:ribosome-associated translation inhibitor RaiA [Myxococcales bacterium]MDD9972237.1 ribosome-associated translation inhibitor RaiA [Myxococcales bacterium]
MRISYTFRHLESSEAIKAYAEAKLSKLEKYLHAPLEAEVTFSVERRMHIVDVHVMSGSETFHGHEASEDMYASIDACMDKVRAQVTSKKGGYQAQRRQA